MAKNAVAKTWQLVVEADGKRYSRPPVDATPPTVPASPSATVFSSSEIDVAWSASTDAQSGVQDYIVEMASTSGGSYSTVATVTAPAVSTRVGSLPASTTRYFRIKARDNASPPNVSAASSTVNATTLASGGAAIPVATLQAAGYIVVTASPYNADPTFTTDSTAAIQSAIDAALAARKCVWIPSGTYKISQTLRCMKFKSGGGTGSGGSGGVTNGFHIRGATLPTRPVIKLAPSLSIFNEATPRPMIAYAQYKPEAGSTGVPVPPVLTFNALLGPGTQAGHGPWTSNSADFLQHSLDNVEFHTNGGASSNQNAEGVCFSVAQMTFLTNVKVIATGSHACFRGVGGRMSSAMNLEAVGGQYAIIFNLKADGASGLGDCAGGMVAGFTASGQTTATLRVGDFVSCLVVGFDVSTTGGAPVVTMEADSNTSQKTLALIDGKVSTTGTAFDNTANKNLLLRNIYITGTSNVVKVGANTRTASGTWKRIETFVCNDTSGDTFTSGDTPTGNGHLACFSILNGTKTNTIEPIAASSAITTFSGTVPTDLVTRHVATLPSIDSGPYVDCVVDNGAVVSNSTVDSRAAIQQAIDDAVGPPYNGRVFLRKGDFYIGTPGLNLHADTKFFGVGYNYLTHIFAHSSWKPTTGNPVMITTDSDANGTAYLGHMMIERPTYTIGGTLHDRFSLATWRIGRKSTMAYLHQHHTFYDPDIVANVTRHAYKFTANGGGRHYGLELISGVAGCSGPDYRYIWADHTTQPLQVYGIQCEATKRNTTVGTSADTNVEITGASNIRMYGGKVEGGAAPTLVITDGQNVAWYGGGFFEYGQDPQRPGSINYYQVLGAMPGTNTGVLIGSAFVLSFSQDTATNFMMTENVTGGGGAKTILWPNGIALYLRGTLNDAAMAL